MNRNLSAEKEKVDHSTHTKESLAEKEQDLITELSAAQLEPSVKWQVCWIISQGLQMN